MPVPSGYVWSREIDPNAYLNPNTQVLTVAGRQYNPGEYYLENNRAYIPSPVPEDYRWIRSYFAPGMVSYDAATKTINLPGGLKIPQEQLLTLGDKTYISPSQLAQYYHTYAATYKPPEPTINDVKQKTEALMQVYSPLMQTVRDRLGFDLKKIQEQAEQQRKLAEVAYETARSNLQRQQTADWNTIFKSALKRGLGASPLMSYTQRKVVEAYAPSFENLEKNRAAQLANIASQAALAADELAVRGKELEAQWASQIAQYAYNALQQDAEMQRKALQTLGQYFANMEAAKQKAKQEAAKLAWEREKAYLPYLYPKEKSSKQSLSEAKALVMGNYADEIRKKIDKAWKEGGWEAAVAVLPEVEAKIRADAPELMKSGINPEELVDYLYRLVGGFTKQGGKWVLQPANTGNTSSYDYFGTIGF